MINQKALEQVCRLGISSIDMETSPLRSSTDFVYGKTVVEAAKEGFVWLKFTHSNRVSDTHAHSVSWHERFGKKVLLRPVLESNTMRCRTIEFERVLGLGLTRQHLRG